MKFSVFDVMDKGLYLRQALEAAGHEPGIFPDVDLLLLDCDWAWASPRPELIRQAVEAGVKVALYPHGGQATVHVYDGLTEPDPGVDLRLEHGPGSVEVGALVGVPVQEAHGWLYSPTAPFASVKDPVRVLFAPLHPNIEAMQKGLDGDPAPRLNSHVYRQLLDTGYEVIVSTVGPLWRNGVWAHPSATIIPNPEMRFSRVFELIQAADVVVGAGTLAAAAVACGKPLVMVGGHDCSDYIDGQYKRATRADEYEDWLRYPFNAEDGPLEPLIRAACKGSAETAGWRERWVGDDGTTAAVRALEHLVGEHESSRHVAIGGVTARATGS